MPKLTSSSPEVEALRRRVEELEKVVAEYVERYGLTELARQAMIGRREG